MNEIFFIILLMGLGSIIVGVTLLALAKYWARDI